MAKGKHLSEDEIRYVVDVESSKAHGKTGALGQRASVFPPYVFCRRLPFT